MTASPSNRSQETRTVAGVVLCGGRSRRMGMSKAWLPWFDGWALTAIGETLDKVCSPILLAKAPGQSLPPTPKAWRIVDDEIPGGGPLAALATAFGAIDDESFLGAVVVTCDQPPGVLEKLGGHLIASFMLGDLSRSRIFVDGERRQPFPGYYSANSLRKIDSLRQRGIASMHAFLDAIEDETLLIPLDEPIVDWDDPEAYLAAARLAGFDPPAWCREALGRKR